MQVLIADDDRISRRILGRMLGAIDCELLEAADGTEAWQLVGDRKPGMAILDWEMPGIDGVELCRKIRANPAHEHMYVVLLTARDTRADVVAGLDAGADDYLVKPVDPDELHARVKVGMRVLALQQGLAERVVELQAALAHVKRLHGLLPICSYCKRIRSDQDYWQQIEGYLAERSEVEFSHGICPECFEKVRAEWEQ